MGNRMTFCEFILARGILSQDQVELLKKEARAEAMPLGKILVTSGVMKVKDVMRVLAIQSENRGERFGDIAIRLGLVNADQVGAALRQQESLKKHPAEVLLRNKFVDAATWNELIVDYVGVLERKIDGK